MTDLPEALRPWASLLELFPREVALALGPAVRRLAVAIGPLRAQARRGRGEPDGFDGLARRGSYERLLLTEWLLRDELPDEFARRAAMGEHGFLQLARREPARSRASVALFDAGPTQLGAPRVAHLAALVVLAQRASAAGARFAWGVLQDRALVPVREFAPAGVRVLLDARTAHEVHADDVAHWTRLLDAEGAPEDLWLVGPASLASLARDWPASRLEVRDVLAPEATQVAVSVRPRRGSPAEVSLELPPDALCVRLLRDPFVRAAPAPGATRARAASNLVFCAAGNKLLARAAPDALLSVPLPATPREQPGRPRLRVLDPALRSAGRVLVAAGYHRRRYWLATASERGILWEARGEGAGMLPPRLEYATPVDAPFVAPTASEPLSPCFPVECAGGVRGVCLLDARGTLFACDDTHAAVLARDVRALGPDEGTVVLVRELPPGDHPGPSRGGTLPGVGGVTLGGRPRRARIERVVNGQLATSRELAGDGSFRALVAAGSASGRFSALVAVHDRSASWGLYEGAMELGRVTPAAGAAVVGVVSDHASSAGVGPALLLLQPDRRTLLVQGVQRGRVVALAAADVRDVAVSHAAAVFAYTTAAGELVAFSLAHDAALQRVVPEASP